MDPPSRKQEAPIVQYINCRIKSLSPFIALVGLIIFFVFKNLVHERFEVTFPIFSKVDVKGSNASPVWKFLVGNVTFDITLKSDCTLC